MGRINVHFISANPLTLKALQNFFPNDDKISLTAKCFVKFKASHNAACSKCNL